MKLRNISEPTRIILASIITGLLAGGLAALLKWLLGLIRDGAMCAFVPGRPDFWLLLFPFAGLILVALYRRFVSHRNVAHGTEHLKLIVNKDHANFINPGVVADSLLGCLFTVGFGGSAGSEGPCAYGAAALGNGVSRRFRLDQKWMRIMIGVGAGAGIAGIFKSPVGGILYMLEVLGMELTTIPVMALVLSCLLASVTASALSDFTYDIQFDLLNPYDPALFIWIVGLGVFCGLYGVWYLWSMRMFEMRVRKMAHIWQRILAAGCVTSVAIFIIPILYGEGGDSIAQIVNGDALSVYTESFLTDSTHLTMWLLIISGAILLIKGILVGGANAAGVAGKFVPAMFIGTIAGLFFGTAITTITGAEVHIWYLALVGMSAMLASATGAPLMAIFITCEATNTFRFMPAYIICLAISWLITRYFKRWLHIDPPPVAQPPAAIPGNIK